MLRFVSVALLVVAPMLAHAATLLVLNKEDNTLALHDPASGKVLATVATGFGPHEVEASPDGRFALVTNYGTQASPGSTLSVIDLNARKALRQVDLGAMRQPHGLAIAGEAAYFTAEGSRQVGRYDWSADRLGWKFDTAQERTHMVVASRDGRRLYTANMGSNSIGIIEQGSGDRWQQTLVAVGAGPEGLDVSPDGRELWTAHSADSRLSILDLASRKVAHTVDIGTRRANRVKFTPDGSLVLVSDLVGGELVVLDARQRTVRTRIALGRGASGILVAPDGARAYVAVSGESRLAVIDLTKLTVTGSIPTGRGPDGMAWVK